MAYVLVFWVYPSQKFPFGRAPCQRENVFTLDVCSISSASKTQVFLFNFFFQERERVQFCPVGMKLYNLRWLFERIFSFAGIYEFQPIFKKILSMLLFENGRKRIFVILRSTEGVPRFLLVYSKNQNRYGFKPTLIPPFQMLHADNVSCMHQLLPNLTISQISAEV